MAAQSSLRKGNLSILTRLKEATRADHEAVEKVVAAYLQDVRAYNRLLQRFLGFFQPLEAALPRIPGLTGVIPDLPGRSRSRLLKDDLAALGTSAHDIAALPDCPDLPPLHSIAQALGCLYVLEGSTLGGQVVAREIGNLGLAAEARAFFLSHGWNVGLMWKRFGAATEAYAEANPEQAEAICESARRTFRALETWIAGSACTRGRLDG